MLRKICLIVGMLALVLLTSQNNLFAWPSFKRADRNKDGVVDKKEYKLEKKVEAKQELKQRAKVNSWWESRADTNKDGKVDATELAAWKTLQKERIDTDGDGVISPKERRLSWRHARSKVNSELEKKYDANGDGWLETAEVKTMLQDKATLVKTQGKARVDSAIEKEYDADNDGIISTQEAEVMRED